MFGDGGGDGRIGASAGVPSRLGVSVEVHEGVSEGRPAVVVHPEEHSGVIPLGASVALNDEANPLVLEVCAVEEPLLRRVTLAENDLRVADEPPVYGGPAHVREIMVVLDVVFQGAIGGIGMRQVLFGKEFP